MFGVGSRILRKLRMTCTSYRPRNLPAADLRQGGSEGGLDVVWPERQRSQSNPRGVEDRVRDGGWDRARRRFPGACRWLVRVVEQNGLDLGHFGIREDRVALPIETGDVRLVERDLFL